MPIDWDAFHDELDQLVENAGAKTDIQLAGKASTITRLTGEEVATLFPEPSDVKKLAELMEIVKRTGDRTEKINEIVDNAEELSGIILTLLGKLA